MENASEFFQSNGVDKTRNVTELFPSKEMENVWEFFPASRRYGESNGEMNGEIRRHSQRSFSIKDRSLFDASTKKKKNLKAF
jgi:hypothetical protein